MNDAKLKGECKPPEGTKDNSYHWLDNINGESSVELWSGGTTERDAWWFDGQQFSPAETFDLGYRYGESLPPRIRPGSVFTFDVRREDACFDCGQTITVKFDAVPNGTGMLITQMVEDEKDRNIIHVTGNHVPPRVIKII